MFSISRQPNLDMASPYHSSHCDRAQVRIMRYMAYLSIIDVFLLVGENLCNAIAGVTYPANKGFISTSVCVRACDTEFKKTARIAPNFHMPSCS